MRTILFLICVFIPSFAIAATVQPTAEKIRIRPSRVVEIACVQGGTTYKISGSSDDLALLRVGDSSVRYEVYRDDFIVASCEAIFVGTP